MVITDHYPLKVFGVERTTISVQEEQARQVSFLMCLEETFVERNKHTCCSLFRETHPERIAVEREREGWGELEKSEQEEGKKKKKITSSRLGRADRKNNLDLGAAENSHTFLMDSRHQ